MRLLDEVSDPDEDLGCADELVNEPVKGPPAPKKKCRHYRTYSFQFTTSVIMELVHTPVGELSEKYDIPRLTIFSWEKQLHMKIRNFRLLLEDFVFVQEVEEGFPIPRRLISKSQSGFLLEEMLTCLLASSLLKLKRSY